MEISAKQRRTVDTEHLKNLVVREVKSHLRRLNELSLKIHAHPETGFQESKAVTWLSRYLVKNRFTVETGCYGLPTAFLACYGEGKPVIAILGEYDAVEWGYGP